MVATEIYSERTKSSSYYSYFLNIHSNAAPLLSDIPTTRFHERLQRESCKSIFSQPCACLVHINLSNLMTVPWQYY